MKNGIKYLIAGLVATGMLVSSSYANITTSWQTALNTFIADNSLNYLSGDLVEVGTFASPPTQGSPSLAGFTVFGTTLTGTGANAGVFGGSTNRSDVGFAHTQIYLVAFNNATGIVTPGVTQEGIYFVDDTINTNWRFPATADTIPSTTIDLQNLFASGASAAPAPGAHIVFGSGVRDNANADNAAELAIVPEPSTWMLVGTGLIGLLGLRRRHS